jgi:pyruvate dehydrogenase E1 component alpha subunit
MTLTNDELRQLYRDMLLVRRFEERCVELYSAGDIRGFLHLYIGEEAVAAGVLSQLGDDDNVVATYREHGHALLRGVTPRSIMAEMFGRVDGCSRGRGGSMHLFDRTQRFFGGNAIVGGGLPVAVGLGLADAMQATGRVTACFFGEGAVAEGEFHESMNLAALWRLPVLFCCENNLYAMGSAIELVESQTDLVTKASSYGMPARSVDGMDVASVVAATRWALEHVTNARGPVFLELRTYRFRAHSMYDPELYRERTEVERWKALDPIASTAALLVAHGAATAEELAAVDTDVVAVVDDAVAFAAASPWEPVEDLERFVYAEEVAS